MKLAPCSWKVSRLVAVLFAMHVGAFATDRVAAQAGDSADNEQAASASEPRRFPTLAELANLREAMVAERQAVGRELAEAEQRQTPAWMVSSLRLEIDQFEVLELLYAQQQVMIDIRDELTRELKSYDEGASQRILDEIEHSPPYSYLLWDELRDDLAEAEARELTFEIELTTAREALRHVRETDDQQQRDRRQLKEKVATHRGSPDRIQLERELVNAEHRCRINQSLVVLRELELEVKSLEQRVHGQRIEALEAAVKLVGSDVVFSRPQLEEKLAQIERAEQSIRRQLAVFQQELASVSAAANGPSSAASAHRSDDDAGVRRDLARRAISELNEALAELVIQRFVWKARFQHVNQKAVDEDLAKAREQLQRFADYLESGRQVLELQLKEIHLRKTQLEGANDDAAAAEELRLVGQLLNVTEHRAVLLYQTQRLVERLREDVAETQPLASLGSGLLASFQTLQEWWSYEVIAVEDRPITIGKIIIATFMLFGGLMLSRRMSRMLGSRMLPRLGVHEGASLALQTIAFYAMITVCGFLTLDMLNIPLTVFTFFGGAAAIAVGFGSQNILNNFMSGLIILGEQPIRVGDLVEIDGLHANIEHIGPRSTRVRTGANLEIIVPNSRFLENNVTNWTLSSNEIRACVKVGVAYGSPVELVMRLLHQAVTEEPKALPHPEPIILFTDFADNSLNFEVHFWVRMQTMMQGRLVESSLRQRIDALFRVHDVTIAFPQRDVHLDVTQPIEIRLPSEDRGSQFGRLPRAA